MVDWALSVTKLEDEYRLLHSLSGRKQRAWIAMTLDNVQMFYY